jgi:hypothetical protein
MKKITKNVLMALAALSASQSALAQSQWWWERFDATGKVNTLVPAAGLVPALLGNPTGDNVKLNKSTSTQPPLLLVGTAVGSASGLGYVTADLELALSNAVSSIPVNSLLPNYIFSVKNSGTAPATATVSYTTGATGTASLVLGSLTCLSVPAGGSCAVSGTPEKAAIGVPAGSTLTLALPVALGPGIGSLSVTGTVVPSSGIVDSVPGNNVATATTNVLSGVADVSVTINDANATRITTEVDNEYSIQLANAGPSRADVQMNPVITATGGTTYSVRAMSVSSNSGAFGSTTLGIYSLPAGSTATVNLVVRPGTSGGTLKVSATANLLTLNTVDPNLANNIAADTDTVLLPPERPEGVAPSAPAFVNDLAGAGAYDVIYGDGIFYAMTTNPAFNLLSLDGVNWYQSPRPFPTSTQVPMYGEGILVETMSDAVLGYKFARSTDNGQTWTIGALPVAGLFLAQSYAEGRFVAIAASDTATFTTANSDTILFSKDGWNWSVNQMPYSVRWYDVTNNGREFVAVSLTDRRASFSEQGQIWQPVTLPGTTGTTYGAITSGNGKFVTLSRTGGFAATSMTGKTWASAVILDLPWSAIAYGNGKFAAIADGHNVLAQSIDGLNWSYSYPLTGNRSWKSLAFGNGVFVGVASDSSTPIVFK